MRMALTGTVWKAPQMTNQTETGETPELVAQHATQINVLNRSTVNLLGIFGPSEDMRALVRQANGKVQQVEAGQRLAGGRVVAIDADGVMMLKNGKARRIAMPGG